MPELPAPASGREAAVTGTAPHASLSDEDAAPPYRGTVIIEWPPAVGSSPYAVMIGARVRIWDAVTGKPIATCTRADITVHADACALVTADLTLFTDEDGEPFYGGTPVVRDGEVLTATFPFLVAEMRVGQG